MYSTPIKLNGKEYSLRYDLNALAYMEDALGMSIAMFDTDNIGAKALLVGIYAGLLHDKAKCPTKTELGSWIADKEMFTYCAEKMAEAMDKAFGDKPEDPDPNVPESQT